MIRIFLPLICAALGVAAASCSQSGAPFAPAEAPVSPHGTAAAAMPSPPDKAAEGDPERRDAAVGAATAGSPQSAAKPPEPEPVPEQVPPPSDSTTAAAQASAEAGSTPAQRRASTLMGMPVVAVDGSALGEVKDIVFDRQGQATHVVVAYSGEPQIGPGEAPEDANPEPSPDARLTAMPWDAAMASIKDGRLVLDGAKLQGAPSFRPGEWPNLDDRDWSSTADDYWRKVIRASVAAHPGAPVDSTTRRRGRRTRDGE
ncbi:MAG TPA: PRC-barrel domain-containing protein [Steroidobacteraceae bacterium]|nr:PRC-barrel domain-containing protein [Steroidobacteraceae bacterium]